MTEAIKKKKRPLVRAFAILVLLVVVLVAAAPTLLSLGPATGIARNAIAGAVQGDVALKNASLGWFSAQSIEGLSIKDGSGANAIDVNVTVHSGLLSLFMSGGNNLDATLSGSAKGTLEPDGTTGLGALFAPKPASTPSSAPSSSSSPSGIPSALKAKLTIERFALAFTDVARSRTYAIDGLHGDASVDGASGKVSAKLDGDTNFLGGKGTLGMKADLTNLTGTIDPATIACDLAIEGKNLRVPVDQKTADFSAVVLHVKSPGIGKSIAIDAKADGVLDGTTASTLLADLTIIDLAPSGGTLGSAFGGSGASTQWQVLVGKLLTSVKGTVAASKLPTSLAQPAAAAAGLVLSEDLGATIDVLNIKLPGRGSDPITLELDAPKAKLKLTTVVDGDSGGALRGLKDGNLTGTVEASPATLERLAKVNVTAPARLSLNGRDLALGLAATDAGVLSAFTGHVEVVPLAALAWKDPKNDIAVALGSGGRIAIGRDKLGEPFAADAALSVGFGTASAPPTAPTTQNVVAKASVAPKLDRVDNATATIDATFDPGFIAAVAKQTITKPLTVRVDVRDLDTTFPPKGAEGLAIDAVVTIAGENGLVVKDLNRDVRFADIIATLKSADAAKGGALALTGRIDQGTIDVKQTLGPLPKDFANLDPLAIDTRGTAKITGLDGAALVPWMPAQKALIEAAAIRGLSLDLKNEPLSGKPGQRVTIDLGGEPIKGAIVASVEKASSRLEKLDLSGTIGKELVTALQGDSESKVRVADAVPFTLALQSPVTVVFDDLKAGKLPSGLAAKLVVPQVIVSQAPGLKSALALRDFSATVAVDTSGKTATTKGAFAAAGTTSPSDKIEQGTFDLTWSKKEGPSLLKGLTGETKLSGVSVPWIETLIGQPKGRISTWTGDSGAIQMVMSSSAQGETIRVIPAFPRMTGTIDVLAQGESVQASTSGMAVRVDRAKLGELATKPAPEGSAQQRYDFQGDLVAQLTTATIRLPKALAANNMSFAGASLDVALETQGLGVSVQTPGKPAGRLDVPAITAKVASKDLAQGVTFSANDRGTVPGSGPSPVIAINGTVKQLLNASGEIDAANASLDLDANVKALPSVFVDLIAATGGTITRSLGDTMDFTAKAQGASKTGGQLAATLTAPFAELKAPSITVKDGIATVTPQAPVTASFALSPGVKEDLLYLINPVFADVELASQRATMNLSSLSYPMDGNMTKLNSDVRLDIGDIKFKNGQPASVVLQLLRDKPDNLEGRIEPLAVNVKNGILTYKDFGLRIGRMPQGAPSPWKTTLDMQGEIDLTRKPPYAVAITTALPASQAGNFSSDVRKFFDTLGGPDSDLAKTLSIGITMFGPLFDAQGRAAKLEQKVTLPKLEDIAKDPGKLIEQGLDIFKKIQKPKPKPK
ncbi:MAG: hypothetical protein SGJ09_09115 [Phycisphaerae bacterium]|nr:hypothetical protein [Phycisphaerae bacterium]